MRTEPTTGSTWIVSSSRVALRVDLTVGAYLSYQIEQPLASWRGAPGGPSESASDHRSFWQFKGMRWWFRRSVGLAATLGLSLVILAPGAVAQDQARTATTT